MMSRLGRFRKSDAFAVLGLFVLLVWTPVYWAQDTDERQLSGAETWEFPEPRSGDRAELDLVVTYGDDAPVSVGPVATIEYREARPGEAPVPATFVEVRRYIATDAVLGPVTFHMPAAEDRLYLDDHGRPVWRHIETVTQGRADDDGPSQVAGGVRPPNLRNGVSTFAGNTVHYQPDKMPAAVEGLVIGVADDVQRDWRETDRPRHMFATTSATYQGNLLFATTAPLSVLEEDVNKILPTGDSLQVQDGVFRLHTGFELPNSRLTIDAGQRLSFVDSWTWVSKDLAAAVGARAEYLAQRGDQDLVVDVVPAVVERGSGAPHPVLHNDGHGMTNPLDRVPINAAVAVPTIALRDLMTSEVPMHGSVSLNDVWRLAREHAPATVADSIRDGARPIEFRWSPGETTSTPAQYSQSTLLEPARVLTDAFTTTRSEWSLALAAGPGNVDVLFLTVTETQPNGTIEATVVDVCADPESERPGFRLCDDENDWATPIDWDAQMADPDALRTRLAKTYPDSMHRTAHDAPGRLASYAPIGYCHWEAQGPNAMSWGDRVLIGTGACTPRYLFEEDFSQSWGNPLSVSGAGIERGPAEWRWDREDGYHVLRIEAATGLAFASYKQTPTTDEDPGFGRSRSVEPAAAAVVIHESVGRTAAYTGLTLVLASVVLRLGAAIQAGAHLPLLATLFSRISRADALLNERRADIIELLRADPGLTAQEVAKRLSYSRTATMHHLETLLRTGQLLYVQNGQQRHYFPPDGTDRERVRLAVARDEGYADLLQLVDEAPGITLVELTAQLNRSKSRLSRMVTRLARLGVVRRERDGRTLRLFPSSGQGS